MEQGPRRGNEDEQRADSPLKTQTLKIPCGEEELSCSLDSCEESPIPSVIFLHGGGQSNKESTRYLSEAVTACQRSFVRFDFSGQGESSGTMSRSSLSKRKREAQSVLTHFAMKNPTLIGSSMGGYVASTLAAEWKAENLILFCPAAYGIQAWDAGFGSGFTELIRAKDSYLNTDLLSKLSDFKGKALIFMGTEDDVIPTEVISLYERALRNARSFEIHYLEGCPHPIHRWIQDKPETIDAVRKKIQQILA